MSTRIPMNKHARCGQISTYLQAEGIHPGNGLYTFVDARADTSASLHHTSNNSAGTDPKLPRTEGAGAISQPAGTSSASLTQDEDEHIKMNLDRAIRYVTSIKKRFANDPETYSKFKEITQSFEKKHLVINEVLQKISALFSRCPDLLRDFTCFVRYHEQDDAQLHFEAVEKEAEAGKLAKQQPTQQQKQHQSQSKTASPTQPRNYHNVGECTCVSRCPPKNNSFGYVPPIPSGPPEPATTSQGAPPYLEAQDFASLFDRALTYNMRLKVRLAKEPETYNKFLGIVQGYEREQRTMKEVLEEIPALFSEHPDLLRDFIYFLPDHVQAEAKSKIEGVAKEAEARILARKQAATQKQQKQKQPTAALPPPPQPDSIEGESTSIARQLRAFMDSGANDLDASAVPKPAAISQATPPQQEAEHFASLFDRAIWYNMRLKMRFADAPETYKKFLEIVQGYEKEQRDMEEVLQEIPALLSDHPDLLRGFTYFLPDHVQAEVSDQFEALAKDAEARQQVERRKTQQIPKDSSQPRIPSPPQAHKLNSGRPSLCLPRPLTKINLFGARTRSNYNGAPGRAAPAVFVVRDSINTNDAISDPSFARGSQFVEFGVRCDSIEAPPAMSTLIRNQWDLCPISSLSDVARMVESSDTYGQLWDPARADEAEKNGQNINSFVLGSNLSLSQQEMRMKLLHYSGYNLERAEKEYERLREFGCRDTTWTRHEKRTFERLLDDHTSSKDFTALSREMKRNRGDCMKQYYQWKSKSRKYPKKKLQWKGGCVGESVRKRRKNF